ncbi:hypothetical protein [Bartonella sp. AU16XJBT]|uniref:hypothetical protein n=1 Tax=Bartonella sp. AU16XJBT TaxID=3019088 RepID=UPI00236043BF|nr:hypothetical protein [Bartonella sp. AU16XJBT]
MKEREGGNGGENYSFVCISQAEWSHGEKHSQEIKISMQDVCTKAKGKWDLRGVATVRLGAKRDKGE